MVGIPQAPAVSCPYLAGVDTLGGIYFLSSNLGEHIISAVII